jgi:hypothetical protein
MQKTFVHSLLACGRGRFARTQLMWLILTKIFVITKTAVLEFFRHPSVFRKCPLYRLTEATRETPNTTNTTPAMRVGLATCLVSPIAP